MPYLRADLLERRDAAVSRWCFSCAAESCVRMRACALGHDREEEADDVDALGEQVARHVLRQLGVVEHHRHDRALARLDVEAGLGEQLCASSFVFHSSLSRRSVVAEISSSTLSAPATITGATVFENRYGRARWRHISTSSAPAAHAAARRPAERLAERRGDDVDPADHAAVLVRAAPGLADEARCVRVVHEHHGVVLLGQARRSRRASRCRRPSRRRRR